MTADKPPFLVVFFRLLLFSAAVVPPAAARNITWLLDQHPGFAAFNSYLTKTNVSDQINRRQTITVLAFDDAAAVPAFAGKPLSVVRDVLSAHVILDYFGPPKLRRLVHERRTSLLTTLFQASGRAVGLQGFLNVTAAGDGDGVAFGSAVKGAPLVSKLVGSVSARPYIISVIQVTAPIFPIGVDPNPSPPPPPAISPPPPPPEKVEEPAESPGVSEVPEADGPVAEGPELGAPSPVVDAPTNSPVEDDVDEGVVVTHSGVASVDVRFGVLIIGLILIFVAV